MAEDISPVLLEKIQKSFQTAFDRDAQIQAVYQAIEGGTATYAQANEFAVRVGELLAEAFGAHLSSSVLPDGRMYYNIAKSVLSPTFRRNYELITGVTTSVQEALNAAAGLGLKAQIPAFNQDRLEGIINRVSSEPNFDDVAWILQEPVVNFSQSIVDDSIRGNAEFQAGAGLKPKIVRTLLGKACDWCRALAGTYTYPNVPKDVYRRHENCRCTVVYDPGSGKRQNVHTKQWITAKETLEQRKLIQGIDTRTGIQRSVPQKAGVENVTAEYLRSATPGIGEISYDAGYVVSHHSEEIKIAQWLHDNFGGDIVLLQETGGLYEKTPDYLWSGKCWELKTTSTEKAADSALRSALKQIVINPGGVILDYRSNEISVERAVDIISRRLSRQEQCNADVMILQNGKLVRVLRYKK